MSSQYLPLVFIMGYALGAVSALWFEGHLG